VKKVDLTPLLLRMAAGQCSPADLATMSRLAGRVIVKPFQPSMDPLWRIAHKRPHLAQAMREASHWRIRAMAEMLDDPAERLCPHLTHAHKCPRCQAAKQ